VTARARAGTRASNGNDGGSIDRRNEARRPDGLTIQLGGTNPIACPEGSRDDRRWFRRNPGRSHRIRLPIGGEKRLADRYPAGVHVLIAVRQVKPGARLRLDIGWTGPLPALNSETFASQSFEAAAASSPRVAEIERVLRGAAP
jgi:hypothetical protein